MSNWTLTPEDRAELVQETQELQAELRRAHEAITEHPELDHSTTAALRRDRIRGLIARNLRQLNKETIGGGGSAVRRDAAPAQGG